MSKIRRIYTEKLRKKSKIPELHSSNSLELKILDCSTFYEHSKKGLLCLVADYCDYINYEDCGFVKDLSKPHLLPCYGLLLKADKIEIGYYRYSNPFIAQSYTRTEDKIVPLWNFVKNNDLHKLLL
jgi:hypothetical protein